MKKHHFTAAAVCALALAIPMSSCIGSFALTNKVLDWNKNIGNKFVNELVFIAFCIVPVYEVTALCDILVVNSIEFWSGSNPMTASTKVVPTDHGDYLVECDGKGYTVTHRDSGQQMRLEFEEESQTWNLISEEGDIPLLTFVDDNNVALPMADGSMNIFSTDALGVMAYRNATSSACAFLHLNNVGR